jgi:predicted nucleic acid binding AN1-type Zn finger protein
MNTEKKSLSTQSSSFVHNSNTSTDTINKKSRCILCRKSTWLLMTCSKCEEEFCVTHQLPESHKCPKIDLYKKDIVDLVAIKPSKLEYI